MSGSRDRAVIDKIVLGGGVYKANMLKEVNTVVVIGSDISMSEKILTAMSRGNDIWALV